MRDKVNYLMNKFGEFTIKQLVEKKFENGKTYYLVKWKKYKDCVDDSWMPEDLIDPDIIRAFEISQANFEKSSENVSLNMHPKKILDLISIGDKKHFLVQTEKQKCYIPLETMRKIDSKMAREFLLNYYLNTSC